MGNKRKYVRVVPVVVAAWLCTAFIYQSGANPLAWKPQIPSSAPKAPKAKPLPLVSRWVKAGEQAEPLVADVRDVKYLVLTTSGGSDGSGYDHSAWAGARLVAKDGSKVWLDELPYVYGKAGWDAPRKNRNVAGQQIRIAGKEMDHTIFCHADGILVYELDGKKYVRFETEVGIDDGSPTGSVYFGVSDEISDEWVERMLGGRIKSLKEPSYYKEAKKALMSLHGSQRTERFFELTRGLDKALTLQDELQWLNVKAVELAYENMKTLEGFDAVKGEALWKEFQQLCSKGFAGIYRNDASAVEALQKALECKRKLLLSNPLLVSDKVVAVRYKLGSRSRSAMAPSLGTQANNWSNQESASRSGFDAEVVELSHLNDKPQMRTVYKPMNGSSVADLKLHWDGRRLMFTQAMSDRRWNVCEIGLDGKGFKQLIQCDEPDLEFYDGTWLPDGRIIANSNIGYHGVPCVSGSDPVGNMVLYDPAHKNLRRLTFDQDANWNPVIMNNGRVMYTRWEYTDLTHYYSRIVMHMNPDGTDNRALFGSGSMFPNSTFDIQPLPGHSSAFVGIISGHHGIARSGRLILFDPAKSRKGAAGMMQEIPYRNREIKEVVKDRLVDGVWPQFIKPTPINDKYFLVAAKLSPQSLWGIYLVDVFDNVTCLMQAEGEGFISPILVHETPVPPSIPDRVNLSDKESTVFIQDIYEGEGLRGVPRGTVKELRIHAYEYAYVQTRSDHNWQGIQSGWDIKRLLGTVPVEEDGSAVFKIPANTPVSIQPLDADGAAVQWMRSWFTGQPGEVVSCVGCHEDQNRIPEPKRTLASQKTPKPLKAPEGGIRSFTFDLEVQPILDRACVACHTGEREAFDLRGGKKDKEGYGTSYLNLHPYVRRQGPEADMPVLQPYEYHANTSELVRMLKKGHYNVRLTDAEWRTLYNWIDYNAPDKGYFNANPIKSFPYQGYDQIARRKELNDKYGCGSGVDWKKELADYAAYLKNKGTIQAVMPERMSPVKEKNINVKGWPFDANEAKKKVGECGESRKVLTLAPGVEMTLVRIPAGSFVMGSNRGESDARPVAKVEVGKSFWMGEVEVTNAQYTALCPEHDSRYVDQLWKDHTRPGYEANRPEQPVIRVSYEDAMAFCRLVSEKTGITVTLPTEAQWEWACRAGSAEDFWYGDMHADFAPYENLADAAASRMAVSGVDPQPMSKNNYWYKYYDYLPKERSVDDGQMILCDSKLYSPNPFGLYAMHGNVAEWTRSDYRPYPYREKGKEQASFKVVRGGSYYDRPRYSTSYVRRAYHPYQRVFNVGFRVVVEE